MGTALMESWEGLELLSPLQWEGSSTTASPTCASLTPRCQEGWGMPSGVPQLLEREQGSPHPAGPHVGPTSLPSDILPCCTPIPSGVPLCPRRFPSRSPRCPQPHTGLSPCPGYYYDLDDSCDDSDEEEVRAHLRCVAEQPPLKLDTSSEVLLAPPVPRGNSPSFTPVPSAQYSHHPHSCRGTRGQRWG